MGSKILVFIPSYRCEKQISRVIEKFDEDIQKQIDTVLVLDNCSTDKTFQVAQSKGQSQFRYCHFVALQNSQNLGLGGSHKVAFKYAQAHHFDYLVVLHGDDQADIQDIAIILKDGFPADLDCLLGSRFMRGSKLSGYCLTRNLGNRFYNFLFSLVTKKEIKDLGSGLNIYKVSSLGKLPLNQLPDDLTFNYGLLLASCRYGQKIHFFPISWREEDQRSNVQLFRQGLKTLKILFDFIRDNNNQIENPPTNIVITMAGRGSRFSEVGYQIPKYEIEVHGKSLFEWSLQSLAQFITPQYRLIFVCLVENRSQEYIKSQCQKMGITNFYVHELDDVTDGQATSAYLSRDLWIKEDALLIYNIDTAVAPRALNPHDIPPQCDGWVPCFKAAGTQWSFVKTDQNGWATQVAEKERISEDASIGLYWFREAQDFVRAYESSLHQSDPLPKGERYIAPLYNFLIQDLKKISISIIDSADVTALGTPADVQAFAAKDSPTP